MTRARLLKLVLSRLGLAVSTLMLMFFLPAGTWKYWQAWVYMAVLFIPMTLVLVYLLKNDPELLERRMRMREERRGQKLIIKISYVFFLLAFLLPGFDVRFGWSNMPVWAVVTADVFVFLGYAIFFRVMQVNSYASRVIEVASGQKVIDTGPYAVVRHPMYSGAILLYVASPLALGSYWAAIPAALIVPLLAARILDEESALEKELPGYLEYQQKTRYRLIPFIW
jgi:protein-S-isoprenylcysteine O-methyltransferase Ste14